MSSSFITVLGSAVLALIATGYFGQRYLPPPAPKILGIDLGTTFSCIGVYHLGRGQVQVIADQQGSNCIPSIVSYHSKISVGHTAQRESRIYANWTIYDSKRFIGRRLSAVELAVEQQRYPFEIKVAADGKVGFQLPNGQLLDSEDVGSHILSHLVSEADKSLGIHLRRAVISVPADFNEEQKTATISAANKAGLQVMSIISEPTAAALAYGLHHHPGLQWVVVVDLGGGTLDVSLLLLQGGLFVTQAMAGNSHLGGQDFTYRLLTLVLQRWGTTPPSAEVLQELRAEVELAKLRLSIEQQVTLCIRTWCTNITRQEFDDVNLDLFLSILTPVKHVLTDSELQPKDIHQVVLVGGSTRVPKVRQILSEFFGKPVNTDVDPDIAVVTGVALQAGIVGGAWPMQVSAIELPSTLSKKQV